MSLSSFITKRYLFSSKRSKNFSVFGFIAVTGIALGVATLIIALSVLSGFEKVIADKLVNFNSHIQITGFSNYPLGNYLEKKAEIERLIGDKLDKVEPFAANLAIAGHRRINEGLSIKGVLPGYFSDSGRIRIIEGTDNLDAADGSSRIIIGRTLANKLMVEPGDDIVVFALDKNQIPGPDNMPNIEKLNISGIFESGMAKYDDAFAFTDLETAQELFGMDDKISGFEIKLNDISQIDSLNSLLRTELEYPQYAQTIFDRNRHIFLWIELQKKPIPLILGLIILVAVFNIISTLLMLVLEKTNTVGTLKALGARNSSINRIFLYQGVYLGIAGIIAGNLLAFLLIQLQLHFNIISLPPDVYFISEVPIYSYIPVSFLGGEVSIYLLVSTVTLPLSIITSYLPSYIATKISPLTTLRFN